MSKKEIEKEQVPQDFISTVHSSRFVIRFNGRQFEIIAPLLSLVDLIEFLDFFKEEVKRAIDKELAQSAVKGDEIGEEIED